MTLRYMMWAGYTWRFVCDYFGWTTLELRTNIHALAKDIRFVEELRRGYSLENAVERLMSELPAQSTKLYYEVNQ